MRKETFAPHEILIGSLPQLVYLHNGGAGSFFLFLVAVSSDAVLIIDVPFIQYVTVTYVFSLRAESLPPWCFHGDFVN